MYILCYVFFFFFKQKTAYEIMPSLVGSEMCIRDRSLPDGCRPRCGPPRSVRWRPPPRRGPAQPPGPRPRLPRPEQAARRVPSRVERAPALWYTSPVEPSGPVSYTHLRAHETRHDLVCRLLLEKKKKKTKTKK